MIEKIKEEIKNDKKEVELLQTKIQNNNIENINKNKNNDILLNDPNKKAGTNSYVFIIENFPNLYIIENDSTYRGFIYNQKIENI